MNGWVKLHKKILEWEWYQDSKTLHLFLHLVLNARHKDGSWKGVNLKRGQVVVGVNSLSNSTGISVQSIRTNLKRLVDSGEIITKPTNKFTVVTICKFEDYQGQDVAGQQTTNIQITNEQQATNKQLTTTEEGKEGKEGKEENNNPPAGENVPPKGKPKQNVSEMRPDWISSELWSELISYRKEQKLKITDLALTTIINAFRKGIEAGYSSEECVGEYVSAGWKRFNVDWMPKKAEQKQQLQPRTIREASAMQCDQIAKALLRDRHGDNYESEQIDAGRGKEEDLLMEYPVQGKRV
jgi:hypothetical protein